MKILDSVAPLAEDHDGFILDIWGVLHDGEKPYPGVVEALRELRARGKRVVLLSNAPRRSWTVAKALEDMGLPPELFDGVVTSGEVAWTLLRDRTHPFFAKLGRTAFHIGPDRDLSVIEALDIPVSRDAAAADFVLNTGPDFEHGRLSTDPYRPMLEAAAARRLPMVCTNPDRAVMVGGERLICAGAFADIYMELGGEVMEIGKPDPMVYETVLSALAVPKDRIVAVGDTAHTDLAGAMAVGVAPVWALTGLAGDHFGPDPSPDALDEEAAREGVQPVAALRSLRW
ncbi:TIGR01459 family HAD-type hydrolase [Pseudoroseomonas globiformis]|uniref:TIGR01459 family HAD-type hydrolase n=1 Tax=Teichococcus globiformis TaxID=2307229 RepID=A0ABV7G277_9PROT